jgi:hypothetical protein
MNRREHIAEARAELKRAKANLRRARAHQLGDEPSSLKPAGFTMLVSFFLLCSAIVASLSATGAWVRAVQVTGLICIPVFLVSALVFFAQAVDI